MPKHKSEDYKKSAVEYYLVSDESQVEVCKIFKCSPRSLMRWVEKYEKDGEITRQNRKPVAYKLTKEHVKFIIETVKQNKTITMQDLLTKVKKKFPNLELSRMSVSRVVENNNITLKQSRKRHEPKTRFGKPVEISKQLKEFYKEVAKYNIHDIISIDETSIHSFTVRNKCYSELGKRCVIKTHSQEVFKKYTAIFAISTKGVVGWTLYEKGGIDSDRLVKFLEKYVTSKYKNKLIIMDNASSHRSANVKNLINKSNKLLHSVVYQHYTNAIENYISVLKSHLQKEQGIGYKDLKTNIQKVIDGMPKHIYYNIFKGSYIREPKYMKKKESNRKKTPKNYK